MLGGDESRSFSLQKQVLTLTGCRYIRFEDLAARFGVAKNRRLGFRKLGVYELLRRQMERLETSINLSTDWLEVQYLMSELEELKALYDSQKTEAA